MTDCADYGDRRLRDRSAHSLVTEGKKVLKCATAASNNNHVNLGLSAKPANGGRNLWRGAVSLDQRLDHCNLNGRKPLHDVAKKISLSCRATTSDKSHSARHVGDRPLALFRKKSLVRKLCLKRLELLHDQPAPFVLHAGDAEAEAALLGIQVRPAK
jgi:hypothetical protein